MPNELIFVKLVTKLQSTLKIWEINMISTLEFLSEHTGPSYLTKARPCLCKRNKNANYRQMKTCSLIPRVRLKDKKLKQV